MVNNSQTPKKPILVIDGYHLLYKGYYGSLKRKRQSLNRDGQLINAVYVFVYNVSELIKSGKYHTVIVALDVGRACWRKDLYPRYKEKRKETPEDLKPQMQIMREFLDSARIPRYEHPTCEGDDVIGTICTIGCKLGFDFEVLSSDKDIYQLVNNKVKVISQQTNKEEPVVIDADKVMELMGVEPKYIPDLKSLTGDSSDNIAGVRGIHQNTALSLINNHGTVDEILKNIDTIEGFKPTVISKLKDSREQIEVSKKITTIQCNLDIGRINFAPLKMNYIGLSGFLKQQKMFSFLNLFKDEVEWQKEMRKKRYERNDEITKK
ncbi:5'-3' exonuclease [Spiroplasma endosymbiont of Othius punctulatus]|uniref:5'-3' exonuclease n=1 Tax=Spiroplasma endosymbiont of Othius punctulatus TaxID=3066289 RepID=UPI0030D444F6